MKSLIAKVHGVRRRVGKRGQALVEFALVLPILLFMLMGIVDFGRALFTYGQLSSQLRVAALFPTTLSEQGGGFRFNSRTLEEVWVRLSPKTHGVGKHKVAKIVFTHETIFHQFVRLGYDIRHIRDIEVSDVRAKQCLQPRPERIAPPIERPRVHRIIGLAAKVEIVREKIA